MRVTILTYGSRGDVEPFLNLSQALIRAGHRVCLAAPQMFEAEAVERGIAFFGLPGDLNGLVRTLAQDAGRNVLRMAATVSRHVLPLAEPVLGLMRQASQDADVIVHAFLATIAGHMEALRRGVPDVSAQFFPVFAPTAAFPSVTFPDLPLGPSYRRFSHRVVDAVYWQGSRLMYHILRRRFPEMPPSIHWPFRARRNREVTPLLFAFSPKVVPPPRDWGDHIEVTGYWFSNYIRDWDPPRELECFMREDSQPVYIGFGSIPARASHRLAETAAAALSAAGLRGVLMGRGFDELELPSSIYALDAVPHDWLFARVCAVVHHGGAGTTGAGLRAGVPTVIVPFTTDHSFWGARVRALGVGPEPVPAKKLTVEKLRAALEFAAYDSGVRKRAEALGREIRSEDGVSRAVACIEALGVNARKPRRTVE